MAAQDARHARPAEEAVLSLERPAAWPPLPPYELWQGTLTLEGRQREVRVRALTAEDAQALLRRHYPEWTVLTLRRWADWSPA